MAEYQCIKQPKRKISVHTCSFVLINVPTDKLTRYCWYKGFSFFSVKSNIVYQVCTFALLHCARCVKDNKGFLVASICFVESQFFSQELWSTVIFLPPEQKFHGTLQRVLSIIFSLPSAWEMQCLPRSKHNLHSLFYIYAWRLNNNNDSTLS